MTFAPDRRFSDRRCLIRTGSVSVLLAALLGATLLAHDGPPFPIVDGRRAGAYDIAVWTDPDATDDGSAGGQFWVMLKPGAGAPGSEIPADTAVHVSIRVSGVMGEWQRARAAPVDG
jgi:hypothetical protein